MDLIWSVVSPSGDSALECDRECVQGWFRALCLSNTSRTPPRSGLSDERKGSTRHLGVRRDRLGWFTPTRPPGARRRGRLAAHPSCGESRRLAVQGRAEHPHQAFNFIHGSPTRSASRSPHDCRMPRNGRGADCRARPIRRVPAAGELEADQQLADILVGAAPTGCWMGRRMCDGGLAPALVEGGPGRPWRSGRAALTSLFRRGGGGRGGVGSRFRTPRSARRAGDALHVGDLFDVRLDELRAVHEATLPVALER